MADQKEVGKLMNASEEELLKQWYDEEMRTRMGVSADDVVGVISDLRAAFINWCRELKLDDLLCRQWDYCAKKKKYQQPAQFISLMGDYLTALHGFPPTLTALVILGQWAGDELCECP